MDAGAHYDRVTAAWRLLLGDDLHYGLFTTREEDLATATAALTARMAEAANLEPGLDVLDVGCGTGAPACHLASTFGVRVVGITTSRAGLDLATARASAEGVPARFELRDGMDNGFADASFDRVWVLESSHLMRRRDALVRECARVLRPGGRLVLCDVVLRRAMPFEEVRRLRGPLGLLREVFGDARMEPLSAYADLAAAVGLRTDRAVDLTDETRPTFARWRANAHANREEVVARLGDDGWRRFLEGCDVLESFWDDGTLGYGLLSATR